MKTFAALLVLVSPFLHAAPALEPAPPTPVQAPPKESTAPPPEMKDFLEELRKQKEPAWCLPAPVETSSLTGETLYLVNANGEIKATFGCR